MLFRSYSERTPNVEYVAVRPGHLEAHINSTLGPPNHRNYNRTPPLSTPISTCLSLAKYEHGMAAPLSSLRLLILSPPLRLPYSPSPFPSILHALSGTHPTQDQAASGFAGYM